MEVNRAGTSPAVSFTVTTILLGGAAVAMGAFIALVAMWIPVSNPQTQGLLVRLAWTAAVLLGLIVVLLIWSVTRYLKRRLHPAEKSPPTSYVDAWSEAGKRLKLPDADKEDENRSDPDAV